MVSRRERVLGTRSPKHSQAKAENSLGGTGSGRFGPYSEEDTGLRCLFIHFTGITKM
jgi:hypothetical protein